MSIAQIAISIVLFAACLMLAGDRSFAGDPAAQGVATSDPNILYVAMGRVSSGSRPTHLIESRNCTPAFFRLTLDKANKSRIISDVFGVRRLWRRLREFKFNFGRRENDGTQTGVQRAFVNARRR